MDLVMSCDEEVLHLELCKYVARLLSKSCKACCTVGCSKRSDMQSFFLPPAKLCKVLLSCQFLC